MTIAQFVRQRLADRVKKSGVLVVYDPSRRYGEVCAGLASERVQIVDASAGSIEAREAASQAIRELGKSQTTLEGVLVYVPARQPDGEVAKQADPYAAYAEFGALFPQDDGDDYQSLCLTAKPDHATEIRRVFAENPEGPSFAVIDAIGDGARWPQLRAALRVESARELLLALLAPSEAQQTDLKASEAWVQEAKDFLVATLGLTLKTRAKTWSGISDELWRYVLFSEFVFDLPGQLPDSLSGVPRADQAAKPIVEYVCDALRAHPRTRQDYIGRAEAIEQELQLAAQCGAIEDLGTRDTFPFEERTFLRAAIKGLVGGNLDAVRAVLSHRSGSVWLSKGESQAQWDLIRSALALVDACEDFERQLPERSRSQADLIDYYLATLREVDRLQREFEQAVSAYTDGEGVLADAIGTARKRYARLIEKVQGVFVRHLETAGWPPAGRLANAEVYDRVVKVRIQERGHKVAYLLIDALRYELGVALEKMLAEDGPIELQAAYASAPTITLVGMASLLPGAKSGLTLKKEGDKFAPYLGDAPVTTVSQRMDAFRRVLGDRFAEVKLNEFARAKSPSVPETVDLLVIRDNEIDSLLESNPERALALVPATLKDIRVALGKLRSMGFAEAVIATDHGFFLNAHADAGDVCAKPQGNWPSVAHDRLMLGDGVSDSNNLVLSAEKLGIRGDFAQAAVPRSMAPYRAGHLYFHGGLSLAEAVVPVLIAKLAGPKRPEAARIEVELSYRNGAKRIVTQLPVVEIRLKTADMFMAEAGIELLLEAHDAKGNVVGEAKLGGDVNPATRTITIGPRESKAIAIKMDPSYEGKVLIKALNPTTLAEYARLPLETDYL